MKYFLIVLLHFPLILFGQAKVFVPDETISNISLVDSSSALKKLPGLNHISYLDSCETIPWRNIKFYNRDRSEILTLIIYPGASRYCFYVFIVTKASEYENKCSINTLPDKFFITESGIKIGLNKSELLTVKGEPSQIRTEKGNDILCYKIDLLESKKTRVSNYCMPEYYAFYTFKQSRLIKFEFGFTYP